MELEDEAVVVTVEVPDEEPETVIDEGDTIVVVEESDDDAVEAVTVAAAIDHEGRIAELEAELAELRGDTFVAQMTAEDALAVAQDVAEVSEESDEAILEAVDETVEDIEEQVNDELADEGGILGDDEDAEPVLDVPPASSRVHPLFRTAKDWFAR